MTAGPAGADSAQLEVRARVIRPDEVIAVRFRQAAPEPVARATPHPTEYHVRRTPDGEACATGPACHEFVESTANLP